MRSAPRPRDVWDLLVDWPRHAAWVPLTTLRVDEHGGHGVGATLVARTSLGRSASTT